MKTVSYNEIIKKVVTYDNISPFHDNFDSADFQLKCQTAFLEFVENEYTVEGELEGQNTIDIILTFNSLYKELSMTAKKTLDEINLDRQSLIGYVLALTDFEEFNISDHIHEIQKNNDNILIDRNEEEEIHIENVHGDKIHLFDAVDTAIDICNEVMEIILVCNFKHNKKKSGFEYAVNISKVRKLMFTANMLSNIKSAFIRYKYEFCDLKKDGEIIKVKFSPQDYALLKDAGRKREENLATEGFSYLTRNEIPKLNIPAYSIKGNILYLAKELKSRETAAALAYTATLPIFYPHLIDRKISSLGQITVDQITYFLIALREVFAQVDGEKILNQVEETKNISHIPLKISKSSLSNYLIKATNLEKSVVNKLLSALSQHFITPISFWKTPLVSFGDDYYFLLHPLVGGHPSYHIDNILKTNLPNSDQEKLFCQFTAQELNKLDKGYKFKNVTSEFVSSIGYSGKTLLLFELDSIIIAIQTCLYAYPIEAIEYSTALNKLAQSSIELNEVKEKIRNNADIPLPKQKDIIGIILSNHTCLSGLNIMSNFSLDLQLLKNYFKTGEFRRAMLLFGKKDLETREIASEKYYETENEFNRNFISFCHNPRPIAEVIKDMEVKEFPLLTRHFHTQITSDGINIRSLKSSTNTQVQELEYLLKQLYYFEKDLKFDAADKQLESRINFLLPQAFSFISLDKSDRHNRLELLNAFNRSGIVGLMHLIKAFESSIIGISGKRIQQEKKMDYTAITENDFSKAEECIARVLSSNEKSQIGLSTFSINHDLSKEELDLVIAFLIRLLSSAAPKIYTQDELENHLFLLTIFAAFVEGNELYEKALHSFFLNFIELLNYNHYYQKARDLSEEILEYCFRRDGRPIIGWLCWFKCCIQQSNASGAAFYGLLYFSVLNSLPNLKDYQLVDGLYNSMLFFRNFGFLDFVESIYAALKDWDLNEYDKRKIIHSYFNSKLNVPTPELELFLPEIDSYLSSNIESILSYGQQGALPWLSLLYNLSNINSSHLLNGIEFIRSYITVLEGAIDAVTLANMKGSYFPDERSTKEIFRQALLKVFETRYFEDFASEIRNLELLANNVIKLSTSPLDIDNLLLGGIVCNDNSLTFKPHDGDLVVSPFNKESDEILESKFIHYANFLFTKLPIKKGQLICWVFEVYGVVYRLQIDFDKHFSLKELKKWNINKMKAWLKDIPTFYFNDKGDYSIDAQESEYAKVMGALAFTNLEIDTDFEELLLCANTSLAIFPHNLIENNFIPNNEFPSKHEPLIQEQIKKDKLDFLSFHKPISNIISLEWFLENGAELILKISDLKFEIWIPINDGDFVINISYEKLKPLLTGKLECKIHTELSPSESLSSSINIFCAHGGTGFEGFRTIYTTQSADGHAIIKGQGIQNLFGQGIIAVLFICDSAIVTEEVYSNKLISFTQEILSLGYKAVIAPAWHLNPDITPVWLNNFVEGLKAGNSVGHATSLANVQIAKSGYNEYHGFYAPTGWAAMHFYGNPNIFFK